jgi:hypothetical protein
VAYVPKSTRHPSLLTRLRPHSYSKTIGLQNRVRDRSGNMKRCLQEPEHDSRRKSDKNQFMSSQIFHRAPCGYEPENAVEDQFILGNLKSFDLMTQEQHRLHPITIYTQSRERQSFYYLAGNLLNTWCSPARKTRTCNYRPTRATEQQ